MDFKLNNFRNFKSEIYKEDGNEYMRLTANANITDGGNENIDVEILKVDLSSINFNRKEDIVINRHTLDFILEFKCLTEDGIFVNLTNMDFEEKICNK